MHLVRYHHYHVQNTIYTSSTVECQVLDNVSMLRKGLILCFSYSFPVPEVFKVLHDTVCWNFAQMLLSTVNLFRKC